MSIIGIDLGTTACKVVAFSEEGKILGYFRKDITVRRPMPGIAEQDPEEWWQIVKTGLKTVISQSGEAPRVIGVTGQRETVVSLNKNDDIVYPAITWMDRRGTDTINKMVEILGSEITRKTGHFPDVTFSAAKLGWLAANEKIASQISSILFPPGYIAWKLTGEKSTVPSIASRTLFYDISRKEWLPEWTHLVGVPFDWLPPVIEHTTMVGRLTEKVSRLLGIPRIPVINAGGDRPAESVGAGCIMKGDTHVAMGTAHTIAMTLDSPMYVSRFPCGVHIFPGKYLIEIGLGPMGATVEWLFRITGQDIHKIDTMVNPARISSETPILVPFAGGSRIRGISSSQGIVFNLSLSHGKEDIITGGLLGIACEYRHAIHLVENILPEFHELRAVGGNAASKKWLEIFAAAISRKVLKMYNHRQTAALGAAITAGVATGIWKSFDSAAHAMSRVEYSIMPSESLEMQIIEIERTYQKFAGFLQKLRL